MADEDMVTISVRVHKDQAEDVRSILDAISAPVVGEASFRCVAICWAGANLCSTGFYAHPLRHTEKLSPEDVLWTLRGAGAIIGVAELRLATLMRTFPPEALAEAVSIAEEARETVHQSAAAGYSAGATYREVAEKEIKRL